MDRDKVELGVAIGAAVVSCVAGTIEQTIKHRAIFKKDGISEDEKKAGRTATYTRVVSSAVATACSVDVVNRAVKAAIKEMETVEEIAKEVQ